MEGKKKSYRDNRLYLTTRELYGFYRYRWADIKKMMNGTIPVPYVPKEAISDHKYALDFKTWKLIVTTYLKNLLKAVKTGEAVKLPVGLGCLQMVKTKTVRKKLDTKKGKELLEKGEIQLGEFVKETKKDFTLPGGWYPVLMWWRYKISKFKNKSIYKMSLVAPVWKQYWKELRKNPSDIFQLNDK